MSFNSVEFIFFYLIVLILYFLIPLQRFRWMLLLASSYFFYMWWNPVYIVLILFSTMVDYFAGRMMEKHKDKRIRKSFLVLSLVTNLGLLFFFKYFSYVYNLMTGVVAGAPADIGLQLILPIGISFYTFQTLSYSIDVYRRRIEPERHFGYFALYVSFFPQLVAGPIERFDHLMPQLKSKKTFQFARLREGLLTMGIGFFKKIVIADRAAVFVNSVFAQVDTIPQGWELILGLILFQFMVYCDFSGYSDIAIGAAKIMGIDLMTNFRQPFFAKGFREYWSRWHISLGTWFKDYLYIPLGGNRISHARTHLNIFIIFFVSGIWHGANITFWLWGALHGLLHYLESVWDRFSFRYKTLFRIRTQSVTYRLFKTVFTFTIVTWSMLIFRAENLTHFWIYLRKMFLLSWGGLIYNGTIHERFFSYGLDKLEMKVLLGSMLALLLYDWLIERYKGINGFVTRLQVEPLLIRWMFYLALIFSIILFGFYGELNVQEFVYFQF